MAVLKYEIKFDGKPWQDITGLVRTSGSPLNQNLCSTSWMSTTNTAAFTLRFRDPVLYRQVCEGLMEAQAGASEVLCRISFIATGEILFTGSLDLQKLSLTTAKIPQEMSLSAVDVMDGLDRKINDNVVLDGKTVREVVDALLGKAGFQPVRNWPAGLAGEAVEVPVVITEDDSYTYLDRINVLLQEMGGYVLATDPASGRFDVRLINMPLGNGAVPPTVHYVVQDKLRSDSSRFANDGVVIKYSNVARSTKRLVYMENIALKDGVLYNPDASYDSDGNRIPDPLDGSVAIPVGVVVPRNGYFPIDADVRKTFQEYDVQLFDYAYLKKQRRTQNASMGLYYVDPATITVEFASMDKDNRDVSNWYENKAFYSEEGKFSYPAGGEFHPRKAWQAFHNKSGKLINVKDFIIEGEAVYSDTESRLVSPVDCTNPYEYDASYICSEEKTLRMAAFLLNLRKHGGDRSTWTAPWSDHALGDQVYIDHVSAAKVRSVVVAKSLVLMGNEPYAEYVAVHVGAWEQTAGYEVTTSRPSGGSDYQEQKRIESMRPIIEYALIPADSDFASGVDFGFDEGHVYGFSADTSYGAEWDWNDGQIDPALVVSGMNVWQRTSVDGGKTWRYSRLTGESAKVFDFTMNKTSYVRNDRAKKQSDVTQVEITANVSGYTRSIVLASSSPDTCPITQREDGKFILTIPYTYSGGSLTVTMTHVDEEADPVERVLNEDNQTDYKLNWGVVEALPSEADCLVGDFFVSRADITVGDKTYKRGCIFEFDGTEWIPMAANDIRLLQNLGEVMNALEAVDSTSAYYAWFKNLVAQDAVIDNLKGNQALFDSIHITGSSKFNGDVKSRVIETGGSSEAASMSLDSSNNESYLPRSSFLGYFRDGDGVTFANNHVVEKPVTIVSGKPGGIQITYQGDYSFEAYDVIGRGFDGVDPNVMTISDSAVVEPQSAYPHLQPGYQGIFWWPGSASRNWFDNTLMSTHPHRVRLKFALPKVRELYARAVIPYISARIRRAVGGRRDDDEQVFFLKAAVLSVSYETRQYATSDWFTLYPYDHLQIDISYTDDAYLQYDAGSVYMEGYPLSLLEMGFDYEDYTAVVGFYDPRKTRIPSGMIQTYTYPAKVYELRSSTGVAIQPQYPWDTTGLQKKSGIYRDVEGIKVTLNGSETRYGNGDIEWNNSQITIDASGGRWTLTRNDYVSNGWKVDFTIPAQTEVCRLRSPIPFDDDEESTIGTLANPWKEAYIETIHGKADSAGNADSSDVSLVANAVAWSGVTEKPESFDIISFDHATSLASTQTGTDYGEKGCVRFSNGLMIQWDKVNVAKDSVETHAFPYSGAGYNWVGLPIAMGAFHARNTWSLFALNVNEYRVGNGSTSSAYVVEAVFLGRWK